MGPLLYPEQRPWTSPARTWTTKSLRSALTLVGEFTQTWAASAPGAVARPVPPPMAKPPVRLQAPRVHPASAGHRNEELRAAGCLLASEPCIASLHQAPLRKYRFDQGLIMSLNLNLIQVLVLGLIWI